MWYCKECEAGTPQTCKCEARRLAELDAWYTEKNRLELERARAKAPELLGRLRGLLEAMTDTNIIYSNETGAEIGKVRALIAEIEGGSDA